MAGIYGLARLRTARIERAYPPIGHIVKHRGRNLHVLVRGQGPDVVLLHGSSGNLRDLNNTLADGLSKQFRVLVVDRPGLGYTDALPGGGHSLRDQAEFIRTGLAEHFNVSAPIVVGHSLGGAVALAWALEAPTPPRALVLVAAVTAPWRGHTSLYAMWHSLPILGHISAWFVTVIAYDRAIARQIDDAFAPDPTPPNYRQLTGVDLVIRAKSIVANARHRLRLKDQLRAMTERYPTIDIPVFAISGDADTAVPPALHIKNIEKTIPNAHIQMIGGIAHMPHYFAADQINDMVTHAHQAALARETAGH